MTLRTSPDDDDAITRLARLQGVSKHEAVLRAVRADLERKGLAAEVHDVTAVVAEHYETLLERLRDA